MSGASRALVQLLPWDSEFFGFNVAFVQKRTLTPDEQCRIEEFVRAEKVVFLQLLCDCHDRSSVVAAESAGYSLVDIRVTLRRSFSQECASPELGPLGFGRGTAADIPALRAIAHDAYRDSRYYFDGRFDGQKVAALYEEWVEKGIAGALDDYVYVLYEGTAPVAFCTIKELSQEAKVGLVGVSAAHRKRGFGKLLLKSVLCQVQKGGFESLITATQGRNYGAQRLYQKCGFITDKVELWFHKWYR